MSTEKNQNKSNGKAFTLKKTFSRTTGISILIDAEPSIIWKLLTHASDFPRWNSTIISIEGNIIEGEKIKLKAKLAPERVFKIKIKEMKNNERMVWGDAMGNRIFTLNKNGNGQTIFTMNEKISGPLLPLFAKMIPSFDETFEQYALDLKKEAETISKIN